MNRRRSRSPYSRRTSRSPPHRPSRQRSPRSRQRSISPPPRIVRPQSPGASLPPPQISVPGVVGQLGWRAREQLREKEREKELRERDRGTDVRGTGSSYSTQPTAVSDRYVLPPVPASVDRYIPGERDRGGGGLGTAPSRYASSQARSPPRGTSGSSAAYGSRGSANGYQASNSYSRPSVSGPSRPAEFRSQTASHDSIGGSFERDIENHKNDRDRVARSLVGKVTDLVVSGLTDVLKTDITRRVVDPLVSDFVKREIKKREDAKLAAAAGAVESTVAMSLKAVHGVPQDGGAAVGGVNSPAVSATRAVSSLSFKKKVAPSVPTSPKRGSAAALGKRDMEESESSSNDGDEELHNSANNKAILARQKALSNKLKDAQSRRARIADIWSSDEEEEEEDDDQEYSEEGKMDHEEALDNALDTMDVDEPARTDSVAGTTPVLSSQDPGGEKPLYETLLQAQRELANKKKPRVGPRRVDPTGNAIISGKIVPDVTISPASADLVAAAPSTSLAESKAKKEAAALRKKKKRLHSQQLASMTSYIRPERQPIQFPPSPAESALDLFEPFVWPEDPVTTFNVLNIDPIRDQVFDDDGAYDSDASLDFSNLDLLTGVAGEERREEDLKFLHAVAVEERMRRKRSRLMKRVAEGEVIDGT
ncbi:hypothetical protein BC830DRAFT_511701 [Chytriomyces sp. MP71]|nr:hypothetical protein BC830DRAFT_511701 [Chytriomyces sp. MP71]